MLVSFDASLRIVFYEAGTNLLEEKHALKKTLS